MYKIQSPLYKVQSPLYKIQSPVAHATKTTFTKKNLGATAKLLDARSVTQRKFQH